MDFEVVEFFGIHEVKDGKIFKKLETQFAEKFLELAIFISVSVEPGPAVDEILLSLKLGPLIDPGIKAGDFICLVMEFLVDDFFENLVKVNEPHECGTEVLEYIFVSALVVFFFFVSLSFISFFMKSVLGLSIIYGGGAILSCGCFIIFTVILLNDLLILNRLIILARFLV